MSNRDRLRMWINERMPELGKELGPMSMDQIRVRLNEVTGLDISSTESIEYGTVLFLEALKKMQPKEPS